MLQILIQMDQAEILAHYKNNHFLKNMKPSGANEMYVRKVLHACLSKWYNW